MLQCCHTVEQQQAERVAGRWSRDAEGTTSQVGVAASETYTVHV